MYSVQIGTILGFMSLRKKTDKTGSSGVSKLVLFMALVLGAFVLLHQIFDARMSPTTLTAPSPSIYFSR